MATYYSDLLASAAAATARTPGFQAQPGKFASSVQYARAVMDMTGVTSALVTADTYALMPMYSNTRLLELFFSVDNVNDAATTWTVDLGLYTAKADGSIGSLITVDCFMDGVNVDATASARIDAFKSAADFDDRDRGKRLYELADKKLGTTTYDNDPNQLWYLTLTNIISGTVTATSTKLTLEAYYVNA